jgi:hypothetical protein
MPCLQPSAAILRDADVARPPSFDKAFILTCNWRFDRDWNKLCALAVDHIMEQQSTMPPYSQRSLAAVGGLVAIALVAFAAMHLMAPSMPERALDLSRAKASEKGLYHVAIEPENGSVRQGELHSWLLRLSSAAGQPVGDAIVTIDGGMPDHGHGLPTRPAVSGHIGAGTYRIEGLKFTMSGWWQLRFAISAAAGSDSAVFNVKL